MFIKGEKSIEIHSIGDNVITNEATGIRYTYMYSRTLYEGYSEYEPTRVSFSFSIEFLEEMMKEELKIYKKS